MRCCLAVVVILCIVATTTDAAAFEDDSGDTVVPRIKRKKSTTQSPISQSSQTQQSPAVSPTIGIGKGEKNSPSDEKIIDDIVVGSNGDNSDDNLISSSCPVCPVKRNLIKHAIHSYWNHDLWHAYACACRYLITKPDDGFAESIIYAIYQSKYSKIKFSDRKILPPKIHPSMIKTWEVMGPINVGKLEVDADPTFMNPGLTKKPPLDPCVHILRIPFNASISSDLVEGGRVKWKEYAISTDNSNQEVETKFSVPWNELVQGLGNMAAYEFQGWARAVTYIKTAGSYVVTCRGSHTLYVRNNNITHVLINDVYRSGRLLSSIDLRVGLVGLVIPLRGVAPQTSFHCSLEAAKNSIIVYEPTNIPDLLEMPSSKGKAPEHKGKGLLLTSVFSIAIHNVQSHPISLDIMLDKPMGQEQEFHIRTARPILLAPTDPIADDMDIEHLLYRDDEDETAYSKPVMHRQLSDEEISIAPGQTINLSLEMVPSVTGR